MSDTPPTEAMPPSEPTGALPATPPPPPPPPPPPAAPPAPPAAAAAAAPPAEKKPVDMSMWLSLAAMGALLACLFVEDGGVKFWDTSEAWSVFAIACGAAQLAPLARQQLSWSDDRAWTVAAIGVGGLALYWLLLVLPGISSNTAFAITAAVGLAAGGLWLAPGRPRDLDLP
jgi:hypothetical protein